MSGLRVSFYLLIISISLGIIITPELSAVKSPGGLAVVALGKSASQKTKDTLIEEVKKKMKNFVFVKTEKQQSIRQPLTSEDDELNTLIEIHCIHPDERLFIVKYTRNDKARKSKFRHVTITSNGKINTGPPDPSKARLHKSHTPYKTMLVSQYRSSNKVYKHFESTVDEFFKEPIPDENITLYCILFLRNVKLGGKLEVHERFTRVHRY